ncbi:MAG: Ni/Fe hydrogenase subunit alpha [Chloroflexi bacterium]|nr:Ni/Fe hydrogenase subunit alpha [Chloroflexota bacterium]
MNTTRTIRVDNLTRVEGEGALYVKIKDDLVENVQLKIYEPPRFFEAFLRGRHYEEVPDITARICGICPIAYQVTAVQAMEDAFGLKVDDQIRALRKLIYCGEWIESHVLHVFMLHAPDFLGYADAIEMAKDHPEIVQRSLQMKKVGNQIVTLLGGREIHPINLRVGGFYKVPEKKDFAQLAERLKWAREAALESVGWAASLPFPNFEQSYEFVALDYPGEYPLNEGRVVSNKGLNIGVHEYDDHFIEEQVPYSNALHARLKERGSYFVGPLARYNLAFERLSPIAKEAARAAGLGATCLNPFQSIIVRAVEILHACDEALRLIDEYEVPNQPSLKVEPRPSIGHSASEAPRGILYHRYELDEQGLILDATIIPPTSQNQSIIEKDLKYFVEQHLNLPKEELTWKCEQAIRNYDPCISCATHFLRLEIERES